MSKLVKLKEGVYANPDNIMYISHKRDEVAKKDMFCVVYINGWDRIYYGNIDDVVKVINSKIEE